MMLSPSGRFETGVKICLSISSHHPEQWQPSWSVRTALTALMAFMPTPGAGALGSLVRWYNPWFLFVIFFGACWCTIPSSLLHFLAQDFSLQQVMLFVFRRSNCSFVGFDEACFAVCS